MFKYIILFVKGFIIGVGKIVPGVSGAVLALSLGVYEKAIKTINNFFSNPSENFKFLGTIGLGVMVAIVLVSNVIKFALTYYFLPTMFLFIGLMIGGIPILFDKIKDKKHSKENIFIVIIILIVVLFLSFLNNENELTFNSDGSSFVLLIFIGIIEAATMIIPGISGTAVMMLIGCYNEIINIFSSLTNIKQILISLYFLIPFNLGIFIGVIIFVKLMAYLFSKYKIKTYYIIIAFSLSSIFLVFIQTMKKSYGVGEIIAGILLLVFGYHISKKLDV